MSWIDWLIVIVSVVSLRLFSLSTRRHMKGVADFLSANRSAGRYLLTIAGQMGGFGVISVVAWWELLYVAGFPSTWWGMMTIPVSVIVLLTGWIYYRFRETRALTLAQFFEMRYNRRFRVFAGALCWACGLLNFGIFPAVAARFFIYFCGLPEFFHIPGHIPVLSTLHIPTFPVVMAADLGLAVTFITLGGQISVMITECIQGIFCGFAFLVLAAGVLYLVKWPQMITALRTAPANASMIHPFHTGGVKDFNIWYFLIGFVGTFYSYMSWQGNSGFNSAARTPHEQKMGGIISIWRGIPFTVMCILLGIAGFTVYHHQAFAVQAAGANEVLSHIKSDIIQGQMRTPVALAFLLPVGLKGLLATVMLFASFTCHDTYMHSWGTIFIQDVYMPLYNKTLTPHEHIGLLRRSIIGVALFSFFFSLLYPQGGKILMFFAITGTIWTGAGAAIIGGLYWKRGTTAGAYSALWVGAIVGLGGLFVPQMYQAHYHREFPVNGQWLSFIATCLCVLMYALVSLATSKSEFNLEKMLRRGRYAVAGESMGSEVAPSKWMQIIGITKEFSFGDRFLAIALVAWNGALFGAFLVCTILSLMFDFGGHWWERFWHFYTMLQLYIGVPATVWFTVGGILDMKALYRTLASAVRDDSDDGRVVRDSEQTPVTTELIPQLDTAIRASALDMEEVTGE